MIKDTGQQSPLDSSPLPSGQDSNVANFSEAIDATVESNSDDEKANVAEIASTLDDFARTLQAREAIHPVLPLASIGDVVPSTINHLFDSIPTAALVQPDWGVGDRLLGNIVKSAEFFPTLDFGSARLLSDMAASVQLSTRGYARMLSHAAMSVQLSLGRQHALLSDFAKTVQLYTDRNAMMLSELAKSIQLVSGGYSKLFSDIANSVQPRVGMWPLINRTVSDYFKSLPALNILYTALDGMSARYQPLIVAAFHKVQLWPAPSMSEELRYKVAELAVSGKIKEIALVLWQHYDGNSHANLRNTVDSWWDDREFRSRRRTIGEALSAHEGQLYSVSIPALVIQIEGISSAISRANGFVGAMGHTLKLGKTNDVVLNAFQLPTQSAAAVRSQFMRSIMLDAATLHIQDVSYEYVDFTGDYRQVRMRRELNRHGILHGIQLNYPSYLNSLRCFLLLDVLHGIKTGSI